MLETTTRTTEQTTSTAVANPEEKPYLVSYKIVYYILGLVEMLLLLRFLFKLFGANRGAGIIEFIYGVTDILMVPFRFVFPTNQVSGATFEWSVLVAMALYALAVYAVQGLLEVIYSADTGKA